MPRPKRRTELTEKELEKQILEMQNQLAEVRKRKKLDPIFIELMEKMMASNDDGFKKFVMRFIDELPKKAQKDLGDFYDWVSVADTPQSAPQGQGQGQGQGQQYAPPYTPQN